jgi:uncharacterized protein with PQ loop repeat
MDIMYRSNDSDGNVYDTDQDMPDPNIPDPNIPDPNIPDPNIEVNVPDIDEETFMNPPQSSVVDGWFMMGGNIAMYIIALSFFPQTYTSLKTYRMRDVNEPFIWLNVLASCIMTIYGAYFGNVQIVIAYGSVFGNTMILGICRQCIRNSTHRRINVRVTPDTLQNNDPNRDPNRDPYRDPYRDPNHHRSNRIDIEMGVNRNRERNRMRGSRPMRNHRRHTPEYEYDYRYGHDNGDEDEDEDGSDNDTESENENQNQNDEQQPLSP